MTPTSYDRATDALFEHLPRRTLRALQFVFAQVGNLWTRNLQSAIGARVRYDADEVSDRLTTALIARDLPKGARLLDVGCGGGHMLRKLRALCDIDAIGVDLAVPRSTDGIQLLPFDGRALPFENKSADVALIGYVLHHLTREHAAALVSEAIRVTRKRLLVLEDSLSSFNVFYRLRNKVHRIEADSEYCPQSRVYRSPGNEEMFLTHDGWARFFRERQGVRRVDVESLAGVYRYAHHTFIRVELE